MYRKWLGNMGLGVQAYLLFEVVYFLRRDLENAREEVGMVWLKSNSGRRRVKERRQLEERGGRPRFYQGESRWPNAHSQAVLTFESGFPTSKTLGQFRQTSRSGG
jgi:hypothetical protein